MLTFVLPALVALAVFAVAAAIRPDDPLRKRLGKGARARLLEAFPIQINNGIIAPDGWGRVHYCEIEDPELHEVCRETPENVPADLSLRFNLGPVVRFGEEQKTLMILDGESTSVFYWNEQTRRRISQERFLSDAMKLHMELRERFSLGPPQMCPRCGTRVMVDARRNLTARSCALCGGLFVARPESDIVAEALGIDPGSLGELSGSADCAACSTRMRSAEVHDRELDVCPHCGAIFFDFAESDDIPGLMKT